MAQYNNNTPGLAVDLSNSFSKTAKAIENRNARIMELQKEQKAQEDENRAGIIEATKYNPQAAIIDYQSEITEMVQRDYMDYAAQIRKGHRTPTVEELREEARRKARIDDSVGRLKAHKESMDSIREMREQDKEGRYNWEFIERALTDSTKGLNGEKRSIADLDPDELRETVFSQADALNAQVVTKSFVNNIDENIETVIKASVDGVGNFRQRSLVKSKLYELKDGQVQYDSDGRPILKMSPELLNLALKDEDMALLIETEKQNKGISGVEALRNILEPFAYRQDQSVRTGDYSKGKPASGSGSSADAAAGIDYAMRNLDRLVYDRDEAVLASFVDHKSILNAQFAEVPSSVTAPGENPAPEIILTLAGGEDEDNKVVRISLANPQKALAQLANLKDKIFKGDAVQEHLAKSKQAVSAALSPVFADPNATPDF